MVSLDQIRQLEDKVNRAVEIIRVLKEENRTLRRTVEASRARMKELEDLVRVFKNDQAEIERGLVSAIRKLDQLEDGLDAARRPAPEPSAAAQAAPPAPPPAERAPAGEDAPESAAQAAGAGPGQLDIF
jgi:FtsZ-binding cell division protein ZapB